MYCKYCGQQIEDSAKFCPSCGQAVGDVVQQPVINIVNQVDTSNRYTTLTSDKSRKKALRLLFSGLGFHMFYVGRIFRGIIRMVLGIVGWGLIFGSYQDPDMIFGGIGWLVLFNLGDLIRLLTGKFRDNTGAYLRT